MTGALGVLKPGSPNQMVAAVLTMFIYLMILLRLSPFKESADDSMAFVVALGTVLMTMIGLLMNLDERPNKDPEWKHFDPTIMGNILIGITAIVVLVFFVNVLLIKCHFWTYLNTKLYSRSSADKKDKELNFNKVVPRKRNSFSMNIVGKAITHQKALNLEEKSETARNAKMKQLEVSKVYASTRVQQRLAKRRKKKSAGKKVAMNTGSSQHQNPNQTRATAALTTVVPSQSRPQTVPTVQLEKVKKVEKVEKVEQVENVEEVEKVEKVEKVEQVEKVEKVEKQKQHETKIKNNNGVVGSSSAPMQTMVKNKLRQMGRKQVEFIATKLQIKRGKIREDGRVLLSQKNCQLLLTRLGLTDPQVMKNSMKELVSSDSKNIERKTFLDWVFAGTD